MEIAYVILAHCDPKQLHYTVDELVKSGDVFIHINQKVDITPFKEELASYNNDSRFNFVEERVCVNWGGFSILKATFNAMKQCVNTGKYDRIILLTGLDYPIKSHSYIEQFFKCNSDYEFINSEIKSGKTPILKFYAYFDNRLWFTFCRLIPGVKFLSFLGAKKDYVVYNGQNYNIYGIAPKWAITWETAQKMVHFFFEENSVNHYFMSTYAPDDYYVGTVMRILGVDENKIKDVSLFYEKKSELNSVSVNVLNIQDLSDINSSECLFARKFDSCKSKQLLEHLSIQLNAKT